ncbi:MAG TPA: IS200/IS605 family transposase, partial [Verrucomicrobiaceae bacterium]
MSQSLARIVLHLVFSTKNRVAWLTDVAARHELHAYMAGILKKLECPAILINGVADHVHVLSQLSRTFAVCDLLEELKKNSSRWIKRQGANYSDFHWQAGYGAFSVSESNVPQVRKYIAEQDQHHRKITFQDEFCALCRKH